jgi:hypothetical protein
MSTLPTNAATNIAGIVSGAGAAERAASKDIARKERRPSRNEIKKIEDSVELLIESPDAVNPSRAGDNDPNKRRQSPPKNSKQARPQPDPARKPDAPSLDVQG